MVLGWQREGGWDDWRNRWSDHAPREACARGGADGHTYVQRSCFGKVTRGGTHWCLLKVERGWDVRQRWVLESAVEEQIAMRNTYGARLWAGSDLDGSLNAQTKYGTR